MYQAFIFLKNLLTNSAVITAQIPATNIYPIVAAATVQGDFIVYKIKRDKPYTKDNLMQYSCEVLIFADDILEAAQKADIVETELTNNNQIYGLSASVDYIEYFKKAYVKLDLTFKIN